MAIRKPPRVQFDHATLDDAKAVGRTINRIQDAIINTVDQLVQQANAPASPMTPTGRSQSGALYQGAGVPLATAGRDGDIYFRTDTPSVALQRIYIRSAGAWVGIV